VTSPRCTSKACAVCFAICSRPEGHAGPHACSPAHMPAPDVERGRRVLVCGGRRFDDVSQLTRTLNAGHTRSPIGVLIHGGARGADRLAGAWAEARGIPVEVFPVLPDDWERLGLRAGPLRNARMLDEGRPDIVVAFPGGAGTADMIAQATARGFNVRRVAVSPYRRRQHQSKEPPPPESLEHEPES
jgi:hypothetical protein